MKSAVNLREKFCNIVKLLKIRIFKKLEFKKLQLLNII